jgi:cytochrome d ubiquinol oxidase subunit II
MTAFLPEIWFGLIAVLFTGYAILDGFDLGVGIMHFVRSDEAERRIRMNAIGPIWDGNEVWLVTAGGALFAAFPEAYATIFSGFYGALMMLLAALILRAVSIEFRGKFDATIWRRAWDVAFSAGSLLVALLFGVAIGNLLQGLPLSPEKEYLGGLPGLLNPFGLFTGLVAVLLFAAHGIHFLLTKTEGDHHDALRAISGFLSPLAVISSLIMIGWSFILPHLSDRLAPLPPAFLAALLGLGLILLRPRLSDRAAFILSSSLIAALGLFVATGLHPFLVPASEPNLGLTIAEAASSPATLFNMLIITGIGMPLVLGYTWYIHRVFRGPVRLDDASY